MTSTTPDHVNFVVHGMGIQDRGTFKQNLIDLRYGLTTGPGPTL